MATKIKPNKIINMKNFVDERLQIENTKFELFAVYFREEPNFDICQVKKKEQWYEIRSSSLIKKDLTSKYELIHGLFYRKK